MSTKPSSRVYRSSSAPGLGAQGATFESQADYREWFTAARFTISAGSPTLAVGTGFQVYLLDAGSTETVVTDQEFPSWMTSVDIVARGYNAGAGSGDVVLQINTKLVGDGDSLPAGGTSTPITFTAGAQNLRQSVTLASGVTVADGETLRVQVSRLGGDGGDTLANDWGLLGVVISPA